MTDGEQEHPIYPDYCHELSPTIGRWCPLRAVDVHALRSVGMYDNGKEIYHHGNHPIKWVRITGVIVAVDEFSARRVFTIDDSSGACIECTCPAPPPPAGLALPGISDIQTTEAAPVAKPSTPSVETPLVPWEEMDVGVVVKIKGKPNKYRDVKQIDIIKVEVMRSTEQEVRCWNEVVAFRKDVLRVPWVVPKEAEEKFKRRAERGRLYRHKSKRHGKNGGEEERKSSSKDKATHRQKTKESRSKKRGPVSEEGLRAENKANYPSLAVRKRLAGKYDALGI